MDGSAVMGGKQREKRTGTSWDRSIDDEKGREDLRAPGRFDSRMISNEALEA